MVTKVKIKEIETKVLSKIKVYCLSFWKFVKLYSLIILSIVFGYLVHTVRTTVQHKVFEFKTGDSISIMVDDKGQLNIIDFKANSVTIFDDSSTTIINGQIQAQMQRSYLNKIK